ncbi:hypothetical protein SAMN06273572_102325 [Monaibacterium marinum]|uniref:Uncharacterized protein n=1 Tax=Pontivivens marinum TaxID=1690039 RepID=A0A2C9CR01_9RHOB|nr:hypothetical protein [Monaibacterium marinum]SOH93647.1 hypothetical protein SAMN06273572_102325 [Monaibacterium marinum]
MSGTDLHFRTRDNGAVVFRIETENRQRRLDLRQLAVINIRSGEIKPHGQQTLTADEIAQMQSWVEARRTELQTRERDDIERLIDQINSAAQWFQSRAEPSDIEAVSNRLLLSMHDLRSTLVKKQVDEADKD